MDVNNNDQDYDDTMGSPDDVGLSNDTNHANSTDNVDGTQEYDPAEWTKPPKKCPKTGRFLPGTGVSRLGGRPVGAKDKISRQLIDICTDLVADKGSEILEHLARTDPAAAMAICLKVVPNAELMMAHQDEREGGSNGDTNITISLVNAPGSSATPRLDSPVERIQHTPDDLARVISEAAYRAPEQSREEKYRAAADAQAEQDRQAAECQRATNEKIRLHGGLTGKPARSAAPDPIIYPDDSEVI